jgi:hypothetical protein
MKFSDHFYVLSSAYVTIIGLFSPYLLLGVAIIVIIEAFVFVNLVDLAAAAAAIVVFIVIELSMTSFEYNFISLT